MMIEDSFDIRDNERLESEREYENALRPLSFRDFSGQAKVVENLRVFVMAARMRKEALDHVLLHGPPGLGKTTLSNIIANELGVGFKVTSGQAGRLGGRLDLAREERCAFYRRDSPPQSGRRGVSLLGDGGLSH